MWHDLLAATALMLVIEGIFPFINPQAMRKLLLMVNEINDSGLRIGGFISMMAGLLILFLIN